MTAPNPEPAPRWRPDDDAVHEIVPSNIDWSQVECPGPIARPAVPASATTADDSSDQTCRDHDEHADSGCTLGPEVTRLRAALAARDAELTRLGEQIAMRDGELEHLAGALNRIAETCDVHERTARIQLGGVPAVVTAVRKVLNDAVLPGIEPRRPGAS